MKLRRFLSWFMACSPILYVGWIAFAGRVNGIGHFSAPREPSGYAARLMQYGEFVKESKRVTPRGSGSTPELAELKSVLAVANPSLPTVESTRLATYCHEDARRPILEAQQLMTSIAMSVARQAQQFEGPDAAAEAWHVALGLNRVNREGDVVSHSRACSTEVAIERELLEILPHTSRRCRAALYIALISLERTRRPITDTMKVDVRLAAESASSANPKVTTDQARILSEAFRNVRTTNSTKKYVQRTKVWREHGEGNAVWAILRSWELMQRNELTRIRSSLGLIAATKLSLLDPNSTGPQELVPADLLTAEDGLFGLTISVKNAKVHVEAANSAELHASNYLIRTKPASWVAK